MNWLRTLNIAADAGNNNRGFQHKMGFRVSSFGHNSYDSFFFCMQFVMETWRMMEEKEIGLNNKCYLLMMQALCKGGYLEEV